MQCETICDTSYEDGLLATLDTSNHEEVLDALLKAVLIIQIESDQPTSAFLGFCKRLDPAVKALESGKSLRRVSQLFAPAVDVLDDTGKALSRFLRFSEKVEAKVKAGERCDSQ